MPPVLIVPVVGVLLLQVPPTVLLCRFDVPPRQILNKPPVIGDAVFTVTTAGAEQPASEYVILDVPVAIPVMIPVLPPAEATDVLLLLHVPPVTSSLSDSVVPIHRRPLPLIAVGVELTVIVFVLTQPPVANV